ncbi:response regulator [Clostridium beijerinckii]|uniref:Stage 0 sporulation protein A homolog n=1 Tax=Clostridium beijerinckii TaxID=1520 RepID=A0AAW3W2J9_CLOBE|nr:response regulator [Clostridium beijerinckii]MBC2455680.1 response regulator [Clostridium beijerinckii]MBC2473157.1 response regulator [Clostridium beijerinckii]NOV62338.1 two-component system chemotaxis response regulator CheY [Clostridium beijerinckii]NOV68165.1 two-component system chemotaxis response regulator CheY [Clostridium beijerinckii]NOW30390.1 two-component system chemotaxis response regulator CheY [Clostridium beijerinckii]
MRILIAEDDYVNRRFLFKFFSQYGDCDMVVNGEKAVQAFMFSVEEKDPYDVICLDIMMPKLDGLKALKMINSIEKEKQITYENLSKKFVITALDNAKDVQNAFELGCEVYVTKPINTDKLIEVMKKLNLDIDDKK